MNRDYSNHLFRLRKWLTIALVVLCIVISWIGTLDQKTKKYVDATVVNATIAYGSARALNAAISVAQSTQIGVNLGGEASFKPLEILDPINDMVEDYSTVMKFSISSLLIQKLLIEILANSIFKWLLLGFGVALIIGLLFFDGQFLSPLFKGFIFIGLIRFMFVLIVLLSSWVDGAYLHKQTTENVDLIQQAAKRVELVSTIDSQNSELSSDEQVKINQDIQNYQAQKSIRAEKIQKQERIVSKAKQKMESDEEKLQDSGNILERWNPLNKDKRIEIAENALNASTELYGNEEQTLDELKEELHAIDVQISKNQDKLSDEDGIISKMGKAFNSTQTLLNPHHIKESLKGTIRTMFNLIAIFLLKTLLLPIAFLYLILRIFKLIWGIDLRNFYKERKLLIDTGKN